MSNTVRTVVQPGSATENMIPASNQAPGATHAGRAQLAMAVGAFAIGSGEFGTMGLLPDVAGGLNASISSAGEIVSTYALGVVVGAPVLAVITARLPRKQVLLWLMAVFTAGNIVSALMPGLVSLNVARFFTGLPHGAYFGVAALLAASLSPGHRGAAVGHVMLGSSVAMLAGSPLLTWAGEAVGWRGAYLIIAGLGGLALMLVAFLVPAMPASTTASPKGELKALVNVPVLFVLGTGAVGFGSIFALFAYLEPVVTGLAHVSADMAPWFLAIFGAGGVAGTLACSRLADRAPVVTLAGITIWTGLALLGLYFLAANPWGLAFCVFCVGIGFGRTPILQTMLMDVAGDAQTLAAALNQSALNIGNALGAMLGGMAIAAGFGLASPALVGVALSFGGLLVLGLAIRVVGLKGLGG